MERDNDHERRERILGRALTVPGYVDESGRYAASTQRKMGIAWRNARKWCRETGRTPVSIAPWTTETLGEYAVHLIELGRSYRTIETAISAIRTEHRILGYAAIPDSLPAWIVRRAEEGRDSLRGHVNPLSRQDLIRIYQMLPPTPHKGVRDRAILSLIWASGQPLLKILAMDIPDVRLDTGPMTLRIAGKDHRILHDHRAGMVCPVCATRDWVATLARQSPAIMTGALWRAATRQTIAGPGQPPGPGVRTGDWRLTGQAVKQTWMRITEDAGVRGFGLKDLRCGGKRDRR